MVLLFSFFFCSGGFLVARAEEPVSPSFLDFPSVLDLYTCSGLTSYSLPVDFYCSGGTAHGSATYYSTSGGSLSRGWHVYTGEAQSLGTCTQLGFTLPFKDYYFRKGRVYVLFFSVNYGQYSVSNSNLLMWTSNWQQPYKVISSSPTYFCFSPTIDFSAQSLRVNIHCSLTGDQLSNAYTQNPPNASYVNALSVGTFSLQTLDGYLDSDADSIIAAIENQTGELDQSITDAGQGVQDKIESQYDTSQGSEVGSAAQGFADQAAESLGVVSYVDTLFSGLSGLVTAGSTTLTFPALAFAVEGTEYQFWEEYTFDLAQLDGWFAGLMAAVRLATSTVVVGAVLHYLQLVYKDVIG